MKQKLFVDPLDTLFNVSDDEQVHDDYHSGYMQVAEANLPAVVDEPKVDPSTEAEDKEDDAKMDVIYDLALDAYNQQTALVEIIDPKFAARNAEVAANFLNIALNAATAKAKIKVDRRRTKQFIPAQNKNTTNNVIVATQEEILRMIDKD